MAAAAELLLEVGTEEIPATFLPGALEELGRLAAERLAAARLAHGEVRTYGTPRRLGLVVRGVAAEQEAREETVVGPPRSAAYDEAGRPTRAAQGFARSQGVDVEALGTCETPRGTYVCVVRREAGRPAAEVLRELLPGLLRDLRFPKSMRWGSGSLRFARPIHWILALYGEAVVPFELDGIRSGNLSRGHRFMSPGSFAVHSFKAYKASCREHFVILEPEERLQEIRRQIAALEEEIGGRVVEDPELLREVVHLVEYPTALCGGFDPAYLALPRPVLITCMREHQRYFAVEDASGGLMPRFVTVSNTRPRDTSAVVAGNERVLRARLADARYFYEADRRRPLADYVKLLDGVTFQEALGSVGEKVQRIRALARFLAERTGAADPDAAERAATLCKADLVTEMVGEFPSLQGEMGRIYARLSGEAPEVCEAVAEHYRPRFAGDALPASATGAVVGLADRLDTLAGCFGVGLRPTGSEDPYGLRRQALGLVAILLDRGYALPLGEAVDRACALLGDKLADDPAQVRAEVLEYVRARLAQLLLGEGHRHDTVEAVLSAGFERLDLVRPRVEAFTAFRADPLFEPFTVVCKRAMNIVKEHAGRDVREALLAHEAERGLWKELRAVEEEVDALVERGEYGRALERIAALRPAVDAFFEEVLVMDPDPAVRENRLSLLGRVSDLAARLADFSAVASD